MTTIENVDKKINKQEIKDAKVKHNLSKRNPQEYKNSRDILIKSFLENENRCKFDIKLIV